MQSYQSKSEKQKSRGVRTSRSTYKSSGTVTTQSGGIIPCPTAQNGDGTFNPILWHGWQNSPHLLRDAHQRQVTMKWSVRPTWGGRGYLRCRSPRRRRSGRRCRGAGLGSPSRPGAGRRTAGGKDTKWKANGIISWVRENGKEKLSEEIYLSKLLVSQFLSDIITPHRW